MPANIATEDVTAAPALNEELETVQADSMTVKKSLRDISLDLDFMLGARSRMGELVRVNGILTDAVGYGMPLDETGAQIAQVAVENICRRLGLSTQKAQITPGLEHFKDKATAMMATKIALESVTEVIKTLAKKIIEWLQGIWNRIKKFFSRIGVQLRLTKENLQSAIGLVNKLPSDAKPVSEYIEDNKVANEDSEYADHDYSFLDNHILFGIKGKCDSSTAMEIVKNTSTLININREIILHIVTCLQNLMDRPPSEDNLEAYAEKLTGEIKEKMGRFTLLNKKSEGNKVVYSYGHFHDSEVFRLREAVGMSEDDQRVRLFNIDLSTEKIKDEPYRVKVLSKGEMSHLAVETMRLVDQTEAFNKVIPIVEKVLHHASDTLQGFYNKVTTDESKTVITQALNMIHDMFNYVGRHLPELSASAVRVASDSSVYVRASVQRHKKAQAA